MLATKYDATLSGIEDEIIEAEKVLTDSYYMRTDNFKNKVIFPLIATSSQPALSMENIRKFTINIPISREEQDCLAKYFDNLDHLITLHQRKLEKLQNVKKSCLEKMFV